MRPAGDSLLRKPVYGKLQNGWPDLTHTHTHSIWHTVVVVVVNGAKAFAAPEAVLL